MGAAAGPSVTGEFAIARYESDGTLDAGFDGDGMVTTAIAGGGDEARSVAIFESSLWIACDNAVARISVSAPR